MTRIEFSRAGLTLSAEVTDEDLRGTKPWIMLVHGFPDTPHSWSALIPTLRDAGFAVIRPWLRGYTPASAQRTARYDVTAVAEDLLAWRDRVATPERPVHLVGHDWGAIAALAAGVMRPEAWATLSLLAIPAFQRIERAWRWLPTQLKQSAYMARLQAATGPDLVRAQNSAYCRALWQHWSPGWVFRDADFAPVAEAFAHPDVAWAVTRYYRALMTPWRAPTRQTYRLARQPVHCPTLLLTGAQDGCLHTRLFDATEAQLFPRGVRLARIAEAGHFLHAEQPAAVLHELLPHLLSHTP